jgi:ammonium transporter, Amt family
VFLVAAGFGLAALVVWTPRRQPQDWAQAELPPVQLPLLAVVGSIFILAGGLGWLWTNPLQLRGLSEMALLRGSISLFLCAGGGVIVPLLYTWFVTGRSEPMMTARGLAAGVVAGLAVGPFVQIGVAFSIGLLAGATVPFVTFLIDMVLRLDDATGLVTISSLPAMLGLLLLGIFADGAAGSGWQMTGVEEYMGVTGQGVSGLFAARGYQVDFPGQLQAQVIGILALWLWGFLTGLLLCVPLGLLLQGLLRGGQETQPSIAVEQPLPAQFELPPEEMAGPRRRARYPFPARSPTNPAERP